MYKKFLLVLLTVLSGFILTMGFFKYKNREISRYLQLLKEHPQAIFPIANEQFFGLPLNNPPVIRGVNALSMHPDDKVIGINFEGLVRAYPAWIISSYNIINDTFMDRPLLITYCETCNSAAAFYSTLLHLKKRSLSFVTCKFDNKSLGICDLQSGSLWNPFTGKGVEGIAKDFQLKSIPVKLISWKEWLRAHPDTEVIDSSDEQRSRKNLNVQSFHAGHVDLKSKK